MAENEIIEAEMPGDAEVSEAEEMVAEPSVPEEEEPGGDGTLAALIREVAELRSLMKARGGREDPAPAEVWQPALTDEFCELYPTLSMADVPDAVWEDVRGGIPLEAAYALWEKRESARQETAVAINQKNATGAWGRSDGVSEDFLSPDEVRCMSQAEVRKHYARIIESMKHWN